MFRDSGAAGFTFHELLVAINIATIGVLGYAVTTASVLRGAQSTTNYTQAANLAHDKMEQLKAAGVTANRDECDSDADVNIPTTPHPIFSRCWKVSDSPLGNHLKQIEVRVVWKDAEPRELAIATLSYTE